MNLTPKCIICGSETDFIHDSQFSLDYFKCRNCRFIFQDRKTLVSVSEEKAVYQNHNNTLECEGYVKMFKDFMEYSIRQFNIKTILDFGSGPGPVLAHLLRQEGYDVEIYDPFFAPDTSVLKKKYDCVCSTEVFEHFSDPLKELDKISALLNSRGILAIMTHFHPLGGNEKDSTLFKNWWYRRDETHISFYTERTFDVICELKGFTQILNDKRKIAVLKKDLS